jgi:hypothetical protein
VEIEELFRKPSGLIASLRIFCEKQKLITKGDESKSDSKNATWKCDPCFCHALSENSLYIGKIARLNQLQAQQDVNPSLPLPHLMKQRGTLIFVVGAVTCFGQSLRFC